MCLSVGCDWLIELGEFLEVKFVGVFFVVDFGYDVFVVIVLQSLVKFVVVYVGFVFVFVLFLGDFVGIYEFEFVVGVFLSDVSGVFGVG